jgi:hypothetical protein
MVRKILGVIAGYAIFVVSSLALFKLAGQNPHANATLEFQILAAFCGSAFSFLSGFVSQIIDRAKNLKTNYILALIIAGFATFSLFKTDGSHWTQLLAIFVFAPISVLGGLICKNFRNKQTPT